MARIVLSDEQLITFEVYQKHRGVTSATELVLSMQKARKP
jgi:hypothetical protein